MTSFGTLLSVLLPDACPACDGLGGAAHSRLCRGCESLVPGLPRAIDVPAPLTAGFTLGSYAGPLGALVRRGKYRPDAGAVLELGRRMGEAARGRMPRVDAVVHVPVPPLRRMSRGFDQGELLGRAVAEALGVPHRALLRRLRAPEQAGKTRRERTLAARGAFGFRGREPAPPHLLLVDDVFTSGGTAAACADELLCSGARDVILFVAAAGSV